MSSNNLKKSPENEVQTSGQTNRSNNPLRTVLPFLRAWFNGDWEEAIKYCYPGYIDAYQRAGIKPEYALCQRLHWGTEFKGFTNIEFKDPGSFDDRVTLHAFVIAYTEKRSYGLIIGMAQDEDEEWKVLPTSIVRPV